MDHTKILALLRRKINEADLEVSDWTDEELLLACTDAVEELGLRGVARFDALTVDSDQTSTTYGITPEPTTEEGHILGYMVAAHMLSQEYADKVKRGALAVSWRSGLEEASTISAEKAWRLVISDFAAKVDELIAIWRANNKTSGFRAQ